MSMSQFSSILQILMALVDIIFMKTHKGYMHILTKHHISCRKRFMLIDKLSSTARNIRPFFRSGAWVLGLLVFVGSYDCSCNKWIHTAEQTIPQYLSCNSHLHFLCFKIIQLRHIVNEILMSLKSMEIRLLQPKSIVLGRLWMVFGGG